VLKKKDLMGLLPYIPQMDHQFYKSLQTDGNNIIDDMSIDFDESEEDEV